MSLRFSQVTHEIGSLSDLVEELSSFSHLDTISVDAVSCVAPGLHSVVYTLGHEAINLETFNMLRQEGLSVLVRSYELDLSNVSIKRDYGTSCSCYYSCDCLPSMELSSDGTPLTVRQHIFDLNDF